MIVIIDYGVGNLGSVANMLRKIGAGSRVSSDISVIKEAHKLILPGVGSFDTGMKNLEERGLVSLLNTRILQDKIPILGLCLGMHLFAQQSEEGSLQGLGWIDAKVKKFNFEKKDSCLKIPHMSWNYIEIKNESDIFNGLGSDPRFYFVHSYHVVCDNEKDVLAETHYGFRFPSVIQKDNIVGVQFHPEKSHKFGMKLLKNFVENS